MYEESALVEDGKLKIQQRVVAPETFYNADGGRFDTIMRQNEEDISQEAEPKIQILVSFGKALAFISFPEKEAPISHSFSTKTLSAYLSSQCVNVCFVWRYEILHAHKLIVGAIYKKLQ